MPFLLFPSALHTPTLCHQAVLAKKKIDRHRMPSGISSQEQARIRQSIKKHRQKRGGGYAKEGKQKHITQSKASI